MTKLCTKCEKTKSIKQFYKNKRYADGYFSWCKTCKLGYQKQNPQHNKNWVKNNSDAVKAMKDKYVANNAETVKKSKSKWSKANPKKELAKCRKYQADKLNATPKWLTKEQLKEMQNIYINCPKGYHVDHIVPLRGKNERGLHVPWNLQYMPAKLNQQKSNKY